MHCYRFTAEITYPDNGQVLEHGDLVIKIQLDDYQLPSQLHGSMICVALSWTHSHASAPRSKASSTQVAAEQQQQQKSDFAEQCFDEVPDLSFQAFGLSPGTQYTLRVALYGTSQHGHNLHSVMLILVYFILVYFTMDIQ